MNFLLYLLLAMSCAQGPVCDQHLIYYQQDGDAGIIDTREMYYKSGPLSAHAAPENPWQPAFAQCVVDCPSTQIVVLSPEGQEVTVEPGDCWCYMWLRRPSPGRTVFYKDGRHLDE